MDMQVGDEDNMDCEGWNTGRKNAHRMDGKDGNVLVIC